MVRLPNELQDMIIDFLHDDQDALRTCSLVCKSWIPSARLHRFTNNSKNKWNQSPISWAVEAGLVNLLCSLLGRDDVDVASWEKERDHPLCNAARKSNKTMVQLLLARRGVSVNTGRELTPLSWAAKNGHAGIAKLLLACKTVNVNKVDLRNRRTPLVWAAQHGSVEVVKLLLERKDIYVNDRDVCGRTAFWWATLEYGNAVVVKLLLQRDDIKVNRGDGSFHPLHNAVWRVDTLKLLLERDDLDVNVVDYIRDTPLIHAVRSGLEDSARLLLERDDIDVNVKDKYRGMTPLMWAALRGWEGVVGILLEKDGVDVSAVNKKGQTAISCAISKGHREVAKLILQRTFSRVAATTSNALPA
jgi:ankyrin repeat protein